MHHSDFKMMFFAIWDGNNKKVWKKVLKEIEIFRFGTLMEIFRPMLQNMIKVLRQDSVEL